MVAARMQVPGKIVVRLRAICRALPEAAEEAAWVGTRWKVRGKTFAHVVAIDGGWPPAYVKAAGTAGPAVVLTFRSMLPEVDDHAFRTAPFFKPVWWPDIAGMFLDAGTDWDDAAKLIAGSYRMLAPKTLAGDLRQLPNRPT